MAVVSQRRQSGFTLIELMITVAIVGILASIGLGQYRDYVLRAKLSEVVLALSTCKAAVTEGYLTMSQAPSAGGWGCESQAATTAFAGDVKSSSDGVIRISIQNVDPAINGSFVYLVPMRIDGATAMKTPDNLGSQVHSWVCGSDVQPVRNAMPANCRTDLGAYATGTFE
jgi:type IV pilus assembly protein PilA